MDNIVIAGIGLAHPEESISNHELVESFNNHVDEYNSEHVDSIASGALAAKKYSSTEFIENASGIKSRYVLDKNNILNPNVMHPILESNARDEICLQASYCVCAAKEAIANAKVELKDIGMVLAACSSFQRPYPAIAIEVQQELGLQGFAFDMNVACASAVFALQTAVDAIKAGRTDAVLICAAELCTIQMDFKDRDSHFIFGDAATAMLVCKENVSQASTKLAVEYSKLATSYSTAIYNNFSCFSKLYNDPNLNRYESFTQNGRQVFKEVSILASDFMRDNLNAAGIDFNTFNYYFMHQANAHMNALILKKLLGAAPDSSKAPMILDEFANTGSVGVVIAIYKNMQRFKFGEQMLMAAFGAGYSVGCAVLRCC